jgi:hypothetical protein
VGNEERSEKEIKRPEEKGGKKRMGENLQETLEVTSLWIFCAVKQASRSTALRRPFPVNRKFVVFPLFRFVIRLLSPPAPYNVKNKKQENKKQKK